MFTDPADKLGPKKEAQHFVGGIGTVRIGVRAIWAPAGPGMAASVDEPLLHHRQAGLVSDYRAGIGPASGVLSLGVLRTRPNLGLCLDNLRSVGWMDNSVRLAMEDDGPNAKAMIRRAASIPLPRASQPRIATHRRERGGDVGCRPVR